MINVLESFFHDSRPKVILAPSYLIQLQIVQDMLTLLPSSSNLIQWYNWWASTQPANVLQSPDALWHVIAALSFRRLKPDTSTSKRTRHEDEDDEEVMHETGDDDDVRPPDMYPDRSRLTTWNHMRQGEKPLAEISDAALELRAPIVFMTYAEHKLGMYRESPVFANHRGSDPSVSFANKIVLVDEMQKNLDKFSRLNPKAYMVLLD